MHLAMKAAEERMRAGDGPAVIEAEVYRFFHQNGPYPGSAFGYRTKEEEASWRARDPLERVAKEMIKLGLIDKAGVTAVREQAQAAMTAAAARAARTRSRPGGQASHPSGALARPRIRRRRRPRRRQRTRRADGRRPARAHRRLGRHEVRGCRGGRDGPPHGAGPAHRHHGRGRPPPPGRNQRRDQGPRQEIRRQHHRGRTGARHPDQRERVLRISAAGSRSTAGTGRSSSSCIPISCGSPPTRSSIRSERRGTCSAATTRCRWCLRTKVAMGSGYGSQHLMDPAGIFATAPGWRIVAPSSAADYVGLMNAALALQDPVLVIEHVDLYGTADRIPEGDLDYILPPGRAAVRRTGSDVTVISYLSMVGHSLEAIEQTGDRRRAHRPALAGPRIDRLGHDRREHPEDQRGADRRAGRPRNVVRRLARRRTAAAVLRLARPADRTGSPAARRRPPSRRCSTGRRSPAPRKSWRAWSSSAAEWGQR